MARIGCGARRKGKMIRLNERRERKYEEMRDLLEDLSTQIEEIREEFLSAIDDLEDKIADVL